MRQAAPVTITTIPSTTTSTRRMTASGPNAWPSLIWARKTLNRPIPTPATSAKRTPDGPLDSSLTRDTRTTATIASAIPTSVSVDGTPSSTIPATTGISAAITPVTGATTPIRPTARP